MSTAGMVAFMLPTASAHAVVPGRASPCATTMLSMPHSCWRSGLIRSSLSPSMIAARVFESVKAYFSSSAIHHALRLTTMAPMDSTAKNAMAHSG